MKENKKNVTVNNSNPFEALAAEQPVTTQTRRLDFTPVLQDKARARATELCKSCVTEELQLMANRMMDTGDADDLLSLIHAVFDDATIKADSAVLDGCPDDDLPKMLESQRSNRSKAKRAGLRVKLVNTVNYISAMYAELLIREKTGKAYAGSSAKIELDVDSLKQDPEALRRKINSLASKKSRLSKLAEFDKDAKAQLDEVEAQLAELRGLRPSKTKTVVKDNMSIKTLKAALASLEGREDLPDEVLALMKKLG